MSTIATPLLVPPGQYPPFAVVTDTDHAAWVIIATALSLSCILVFSIIKLFIRWSISASVGPDEACLAVSTIFAVIQSSVVLGACAKGLGKSIELLSDSDLDKTQQMYYVSTLLFMLSLGLSKISVAYLLLRLTPQRSHRKVFQVIILLMAAWTLMCFLALALQCNHAHPWIVVQATCPNTLVRLQIICVLDIAFELCLVGMTMYLVWNLQTSLETKISVVFSFGMRLPLIIAIAFRLATFNNLGWTTNPTFLEDKFIVWTQAEMCYSIMAAIIPSLRPFIRSLATNYGTTTADGYGTSGQSSYGHDNEGEGSSGNYQLSNLRPKTKGDEYKYRIWSGEKGGEASRKDTNTDDAASTDSRRMIIKKDLEWEVAADPK